MKCSDILKLLTLSLVLLVSCERESLPIEEPGELIRIEASGTDVQTRGLLNADDLKTAGTIVKIYDYLTGFTGKIGETSYTNGDVMYIDDAVKLGTTGGDDWAFQAAPWRWTRTGTHHFFGWLTEDAKSGLNVSALCAPTFANNTLTVPAITFAKDTKQFDFSYSDIVTKTAPSDVEIPLKHLFTALAVEIRNGCDETITVNSISFSNIQNGRSATVDYSMGGTSDTRKAVLTDGTKELFSVCDTPVSVAKETVVNAYTGGTLTGDEHDFRLLWPQDNCSSSEVSVTFSYGGKTTTLSASLDGSFDNNKMLDGTKYRIVISVSPKELYILPTVLPWKIASEFTMESSITTSLRCVDASYRGINLTPGWGNAWAEYMAISYGYQDPQDVTVTTPGDEDRPKYASRIELKTTSNNSDLILGLDNDKFKFVTYHEETYQYVDDQGIAQTGIRHLYNHSYTGGQPINLSAGENTLYFYVVPVEPFDNDATVADKTVHVYLATSSADLGSIRQPFNYGALPGNSAGSDEIWVYYVPSGDYGDDTKTDPYTPGN